MDTAYLHLITNHIPIIGIPFALFILVLGIWRKSDELKTASFLVFVFLGIATVSVYFSGRGSEEFIEHVAGVSETAIEGHEDFAVYALIAVELVALLSVFALLRYRGFRMLRPIGANGRRALSGLVVDNSLSNYPAWIVLSVLAFSLASAAMLGYTGKLGGQIRHTEFYTSTQNAQPESGPEKEAEEEDDED